MKEQISFTPKEVRMKEIGEGNIKFRVFREFITPFTGSNILFATTESGISVAIKISNKKGGVEREWIGLNKAYEAGIPTPTPIALAEDQKGVPVLITQKIEGEHLYFHQNDQIKRELGKIVRFMHRNTKIDGEEWNRNEISDFSYFDHYVFQWLQGPTQSLNRNSLTQTFLRKFEDAMEEYYKTASPVFTHGDLHDGQVLLRQNNNLVLIDFENWEENTWLGELGGYLFHSIRTERGLSGLKEFVDGYLGGGKLKEREKSALMFYILFISANAVSYFQRKRSAYFETALTNHEKVLQFIDEERIWKIID